jgi:serine/threonine protein kinase
LASGNDQEFQDEFDMLSALNLRHNQHLVKLLATFKKDNKYHLVFPCAQYNLRDFWDNETPVPAFNQETYLWALDQLTGLASAIDAIHNFSAKIPQGKVDGNNGLSRIRPSGHNQIFVEKGEEKFGRHCDLKPENILWLAEPNNPKGILQITDFGGGRFHRLVTRSRIDPKTVMGSATYIPPEIELEIPVSRVYDIWSLGCIYLEFVTWLLWGSKAVYDFSTARSQETKRGFTDDNFFTVIAPGKSEVRAGVVAWVARLRRSERCSQMVNDILDLTMDHMLSTNMKKRIGSTDLKEALHQILEKARYDSTYLLRGNAS